MQTPLDKKALSALEKNDLITLLMQQNEILMVQCARIAGLEKEIEELKGKLAKNSRNSSKPPSSDGYDKPKPKSQRKKSGRSSGGQPGHKGSTLKQVEHPDNIQDHEVSHCTHCHADLSNQAMTEHEARQVFDLPEIKISVTEHRAQIKICPCCNARVKAEFPADVTQAVQYGKRVHTTAAYLSQYQLLPYKRLQELFHDLFQIKLSQGTLNNILNRGHRHLERFENAVKTVLRESDVVHFDESGIRLKKNLNWLHVASTQQLTCYHIDARRGQAAMDVMAILPGYQGYAVHDHWASYYGYDCQHVLCNAHHLRELTFAQEQYQQRWAAELSQCLLDAKKEVDDAKEIGAQSLDTSRVIYFDRRYSRLLRAGRDELPVLPIDKSKKRGKKKQHKVKNLHDRLVKHKKEVLAFLVDFSLPFDNNLAERDVRMVKVKQKVSGCFRSDQGAKTFCRIRGYISTVKKQGHNVFNALSDAFEGAPLIISPTKK
ncbi:MAG: IS66 family transposase [Gammaproteobacteria bacterium]|nr:IS66 family transposase [Gammaproteobacteria bacterium]